MSDQRSSSLPLGRRTWLRLAVFVFAASSCLGLVIASRMFVLQLMAGSFVALTVYQGADLWWGARRWTATADRLDLPSLRHLDRSFRGVDVSALTTGPGGTSVIVPQHPTSANVPVNLFVSPSELRDWLTYLPDDLRSDGAAGWS